MARYQHIDTQPTFLPVTGAEQEVLLPVVEVLRQRALLATESLITQAHRRTNDPELAKRSGIPPEQAPGSTNCLLCRSLDSGTEVGQLFCTI